MKIFMVLVNYYHSSQVEQGDTVSMIWFGQNISKFTACIQHVYASQSQALTSYKIKTKTFKYTK